MEWNNGQWVISFQDTSIAPNKDDVSAPPDSSVRRCNKRDTLTNANGTSPETSKQTHAMDWGIPLDLDTSTPYHQQSLDANQPYVPTQIKGNYEKHPIKRKRGRPWKLRVVVAETADQTPTRVELVKPSGQIVLGLPHNGNMTGSRVKNSGSVLKVEKKAVGDEGEQLAASPDPESTVNESQTEGEVTNLKRKRGRPPKALLQLGSPKTNETGSVGDKRQEAVDVEGSIDQLPLADAEENSVGVVEPLPISISVPSSDPHTKYMSITSGLSKQVGDIRRLSFGKRSTGRRRVRKDNKFPIAKSVEPASTFMLRGKKLKPINLAALATEDSADSSSGRAVEDPNDGVGRDVTVVAATSNNAYDDDRPLSAWLEGCPPSATDARLSQWKKVQEDKDENSAGNSNDATNRPDEILIQSTAIVPRENQELPFVKNSLIWGVIESMEVLKRIPQKPHFLPLYDCKQECREGLAIGSMVTFTTLVEKISRSRFNDPKSLLDGYLEALVDLEKLGFDVVPMRELLHKLISIKSGYEQAQITSKEIENHIMEQTHEKSKISDEIAELEKKIMELKEKQALAVSRKESKESEITLLQSSMDALKGDFGSAQEDFVKVSTSLW